MSRSYGYDLGGNVVKTVDARSIEADFTYDALNRPLSKSFPASPPENVTFSYDSTAAGNDGIGRLTQISEASGTTSFLYNSLGQITQDQRVIGGYTFNVSYTNDLSGNVMSAAYPSGRIVTFTRDTLGRITQATTQPNSLSSPTTVVSGVTYQPFSGVAGATFGNGAVLAISRDLDGRISSINTAIGGTGIQNLSYGYDLASNITSITDGLSSGRSQAFTYDNLNRLASGAGYYGSLSYTYDGVGNRLTAVNGSTTDTYAYSTTANQISTITRGSNIRTLSYLGSGQTSEDVRNPTTDVTYGYDSSGRLASASINGSTVGAYTHNALGQRVSKTAGSSTTVFLYDRAGHLIEETNSSGSVLKDYLWLDDMPIGQVDDTGSSPALYFVHTDHLNRPQKLTDASGAIAWDGIFDPFGITISATGPATNLLMFPGQYADSESSLSQNWMRDYDPSTGRYLESDPIGLGGGINTYGYAFGNPITDTDPTGELGVTGALGGAAFNFAVQMGTLTYKNGGQVGAAFRCVNFTNVMVAAAFGAVLPGFIGVSKSAVGFFAGSQTGLQFSSNLILWGLVGIPNKAALDLTLPPLRIGNDCECNLGDSYPAAHMF